MTNLHSWGNYPKIKTNVLIFSKNEELKDLVHQHEDMIPFGNGKSYGDSALSKNIIHTKSHHLFLNFHASKGLLHVQAGVLLSEILDIFVPKGWFLKITPGTKLITVGGAIASDVHGKNHHLNGCFSECVEELSLMLPDGSIVNCSRKKNIELFQASCGGMGLTGIILSAKIFLKKVHSAYLNQTTIKTKNLQQTFDSFEKNQNAPYSVAWIDCLATGKQIGKALLILGDFRDDGKLNYSGKKGPDVPFYFPSFALNTATVKIFNFLYYQKVRKEVSHQIVDIDSFFYPLDSIGHWNKIYGKNGFTQYQCIFPKETSYEGLEAVLKEISNSGMGSFLAVLKLYGKENQNYLSFPIEGYSLALDFKIEKKVFALLDSLDQIVLRYGGRIYLAKDVRVKRETFEQGYPQIELFRRLRKKYQMDRKFNSLQSQRLGI